MANPLQQWSGFFFCRMIIFQMQIIKKNPAGGNRFVQIKDYQYDTYVIFDYFCIYVSGWS